MKPSFLLLMLPLLALASCKSNAPIQKNYLSTYGGMEAETGLLSPKALVRKGDQKVLQSYNKIVVEDVKVLAAPQAGDLGAKTASKEETARLADKFETILEKELANDFTVTSRRGRGTMALRAAVTELQPSNPALFALNYAPYASWVGTGLKVATGKTPGAGATTMEAEVVDSVSRRQLYGLVDQVKGGKFKPSGMARWGQTEQAFRIWARRIRQDLKSSGEVAKVQKVDKVEVAGKKVEPKKKEAAAPVVAAKKKPAETAKVTAKAKPEAKKAAASSGRMARLQERAAKHAR